MDWYLDPANGDNKNGGDSWGAPVLTGTDGHAYGTDHYTSATGGFTGLEGRKIAAYDTNGVWTILSVVSDTEIIVDRVIPNWGAGLHFRVGGPFKDPSSAYQWFVDGDRVKLPKTAHCDPAGAGDVTYAIGSRDIGFDSGRVKVVDQCESGWTAVGTDITVTAYNYYQLQGASLTRIQETAYPSTRTGKIAYKDFGEGNELDLSDFQGLSFVARTSGYSYYAMPANMLQLCLCSDATGDTVVDTITFDQAHIMGVTNQFLPLRGMRDGGGNLGDSIRSVALYVRDIWPYYTQLDIDNIVAIHDFDSRDHLCHGCVLSQGQDFPGDWWPMGSFESDTTGKLSGKFCEGDAGAVASYRMEVQGAPGLMTQSNVIDKSNPFTFSGGWDTDTDEQNGVTAWCLWNQNGYYDSNCLYLFQSGVVVENFLFASCVGCVGMSSGTVTDVEFRDVVFCAYLPCTYLYPPCIQGQTGGQGYDAGAKRWKFVRVTAVGFIYPFWQGFSNSLYNGYYRQGLFDWYLEDLRILNCGGLEIGGSAGLRGKNVLVSGNNTEASTYRGVYVLDYVEDVEIDGLTIKNCGQHAFYAEKGGKNVRILNLVTAGHTIAALRIANMDLRLLSPVLGETLKWQEISPLGRLARINDGGVAGVHVIDNWYGNVSSESSIRHTPSGVSWKMSPTNTEYAPLRLKIAEIPLKAGIAVTIGLWLRRTNTALKGRIFIPDGQVAGINGATASLTANANIFSQVTLNVTPAQDGVCELWAEAQGGTTYSLYADDLSVV